MTTTTLAAFGIASFVINTVGLIPYVRDILGHKTKPQRATWWIWLALNCIALAAQVAAGARWSLLFTAGSLLAVLLIALLSIKYGYGKFERKDGLSLMVALGGVVLWVLTKQPLAALLIVMAIDLIGYGLTFAKTWRAPHTETLIAWVLSGVAGTLGVLAVGDWDLAKLIYPLYITVVNWLLALMIMYRRRVI